MDVAFARAVEGFVDEAVAVDGGEEVFLNEALRMEFGEGFAPAGWVGSEGREGGECPDLAEFSEGGEAGG